MPATTTTTEDIPEHIAKDITEIGAAAKATAATVGVNPGMTKLVIGSFFVFVGQDLIGFFDFFKAGLGRLIARVAVRVILHRQALIGLLDLPLAGVATDAQYFVIISL